MSGAAPSRRRLPRWAAWLEISCLLTSLAGLGVARFSRLTEAERLEIQLEAGLEQLYYLELDHRLRHGTYFPPDAAAYRAYLPWMDRYAVETRCRPDHGFSAVVRADLNGDGQPGSWRIDQDSPVVRRVAED